MARIYTTTFDAADKIHQLLADTFDGTAVGTAWGYPGEQAAAELVWVGGFESADQETAALGQRTRDERYSIAVYVDIARNTGDPADVNDRGRTLVRQVEQAVHNNPQLDGLLISAMVDDIESVTDVMPISETAYAGVWRVRVACHARI